MNPNGSPTTVTFCYSASSAMTNCSGATTLGASPSPVSGTTPTSVTAPVTGLAPGTTFYVQVKATNAQGTTYGAVIPFTTAATPTVTTTAATAVSTAAATINGTVNPNSDPSTTASFCYSTSSSLTNCVGATSVSATPSSPTGSTATSESASLSGLAPSTTY